MESSCSTRSRSSCSLRTWVQLLHSQLHTDHTECRGENWQKTAQVMLFWDTFTKFAIAPVSNQDVVIGRSLMFPFQPRHRIISSLHSVDAIVLSAFVPSSRRTHPPRSVWLKSTLKAKAMAQQCFDSWCIELLNSPISYKQTKKKTSKPVRSASVALIPSAPLIKAADSGGRPRPDAQPVSAFVLSGSQTIHLPTTRESPAGWHRLLLPPLQKHLFVWASAAIRLSARANCVFSRGISGHLRLALRLQTGELP